MPGCLHPVQKKTLRTCAMYWAQLRPQGNNDWNTVHSHLAPMEIGRRSLPTPLASQTETGNAASARSPQKWPKGVFKVSTFSTSQVPTRSTESAVAKDDHRDRYHLSLSSSAAVAGWNPPSPFAEPECFRLERLAFDIDDVR